MPMLYNLMKSVHIIAMVLWFGGTMTAVLALAYAKPEITAKFTRFDRLVTTPALILVWWQELRWWSGMAGSTADAGSATVSDRPPDTWFLSATVQRNGLCTSSDSRCR